MMKFGFIEDSMRSPTEYVWLCLFLSVTLFTFEPKLTFFIFIFQDIHVIGTKLLDKCCP
jgi:hypothetical protein